MGRGAQSPVLQLREEDQLIHVGLWRAVDPTYMGERDCAVCDVPFEVEAVFADAWTGEHVVSGPVCPACIEHLGKRNPKLCPTLEEFEEARRLYPEPFYTYEPEEHLWLQAVEASYIDRDKLRANA
jgi:hypothetical protein